MKVKVNGEMMTIDDGRRSISDLLHQLEIRGGAVAVEKNGEVVPRARHDGELLAEGDVLEIVHFVGGG